MGVALSLKTLAGESRVSWAWTIVAPSVCRFGRVGKGLSMINYYAVRGRYLSTKRRRGFKTHDIFPADAIFCRVVSVCLKKKKPAGPLQYTRKFAADEGVDWAVLNWDQRRGSLLLGG